MAKPILDDELWSLIEPLLPRPKPRRTRYPGCKPLDDRAVLTGILFVLQPAAGHCQNPRLGRPIAATITTSSVARYMPLALPRTLPAVANRAAASARPDGSLSVPLPGCTTSGVFASGSNASFSCMSHS